MGIVVTKTASSEDLQRHRKIEEGIREDRKQIKSVLKILLLGARESGKSTIVKQMRILHCGGFENDEVERQKSIIYRNVLCSMSAILKAMIELQIDFYNEAIQTEAIVVIKAEENWQPGGSIASHEWATIKLLWNDGGVQQCFARANEYQLCDSAKFFLDDIDRISSRGYIPTQDDLLRAREGTVGIVECVFRLDRLTLRMIDVGGQRSERKKWIHCFEGVSSVIFVASLSEYNQMLFEDFNMNRMHESLKLFETVINCYWFRNSAMMLFLNKKDIFAEKLHHFSLTASFPEYKGSNSYKECSQYVQERYESRSKNSRKLIYTHKTCATDTNNIKFVMDASLDIIMANNLSDAGLVSTDMPRR